MTAHAEGGEKGASHTYENVTCSFCGLLCDDLQVTRTGSTLKVSNCCPRATAGFQRPLPPAKPLVRDREVSFEEAVKTAAGLIREAKLPLYQVLEVRSAARSPISLEEPVGDEGESSFSDFLADTDAIDPSDAVADRLQQPTRGSDGVGHTSPHTWPCTDWGLPCRRCCQRRGGLLPHRFTLA